MPGMVATSRRIVVLPRGIVAGDAHIGGGEVVLVVSVRIVAEANPVLGFPGGIRERRGLNDLADTTDLFSAIRLPTGDTTAKPEAEAGSTDSDSAVSDVGAFVALAGGANHGLGSVDGGSDRGGRALGGNAGGNGGVLGLNVRNDESERRD